MRPLRVIIVGLMIMGIGYAQDTEYQPAFWNLMDLNGKIELLGTYRIVNSQISITRNKIENTFWSGRLDVDTQSYVWHPNFMVLNVGGTYFPGAGQNSSLLQPDFAIESVSQQLRLSTTIFRKKQLNYRAFFNYSNSYSNAENINENKNYNFDFGGNITFRNKFAPLRFNYLNFDRQQEQKFFNRTFINKGDELTLNTKTSFSDFDSHDVKFSHRNLTNELLGVYKNILNSTTINLNDRIYFDSKKSKFFSSYISYLDITGVNAYKRFSVNENLIYTLPNNFNFTGSFNFNNIEQNSQKIDNINYSGVIRHKLYESVDSYIGYESRTIKQTAFNETSNFVRAGFTYTKKLPFKSNLTLSYNYALNKLDRDSKPINISYFNESVVLSDTEVTLIPYPNVLKETIIVKDISGSLIYQENVDYIIIENNNFYQIQRLPGGLIPNNTQVYLDFITQSLGSFNYISTNHRFSSQLSFYNNLVNVYYRHFNLDYNDVNVTNTNILNYTNQNVIGVQLHYDGIELGAEKDHYNSTIVPYKLNAYFLNINGRLNKKLTYVINANVRDYDMIGEEGRTQLFVNASGNLAYQFNHTTKLIGTAGYRKQEGEGIDLDLFTSRAEFSTSFNKLTISISADLYRRHYLLTEDYNFSAINLKVTRIF
ncbi:hypothetical protein [Aestuariivivens marinum]|uniref:hypothetical protein n=1 Tax=Aestuariivivens marinum TaxID=2913555 RepID=UPI001F59746F|nr:hypothetical protein [Aestuariivivens marinum]